MTTPNDTPDDTTRRTDTTTDRDSTTDPDSTTRTGDPSIDRTGDATTDQSASPRTIPGRTPLTEEAGAPLVPPIATRERPTGGTGRPADSGPAGDGDRRTATSRSPGSPPRTETAPPTRPPADDERDAPLVPDLRPASRTRTDGGSR